MRPTAPELILHSGQVRTADGWAQALSVTRGVIRHVGADADVMATAGPDTRMIDLHGRVVLPGLHDLHVHPIYAGIRERRCKIPQGSSLDQTLAIVKAAAAAAAPGEWVLGGQWDAAALGCIPDRHMLDSVAPDVPVQLEDTSGHSSWANTAALRMAGYDSTTPDPEGGIFERDAAGELTGIQREQAAYLLAEAAPKPSQAEIEQAIEWSLAQMLSYGITSFTEAALGFTAGARAEMDAYEAVARRGGVKQRVRISITWHPDDADALEVIARRNEHAFGRMRTDGIKIFLDGVPTDGHTAAMLQPYADTIEGRDDHASRYGMLQVPQSQLDEVVTRFDRMGLTVKFHAAGDAAVRAGLDAIESARATNGVGPCMHNVGHCTFVATEDVQRAVSIGAVFEVSPYLWQPAPICSDIAAAVGPEVIRRVWPVRDMLDAGALVVAGSDWSVVPSVNPWVGIETLVTRQEPGGSAETFGPDQAITLAEALDIFTVNAARQEGMADRVGRIAEGWLADLIVVDQNPFEVAATQVHATEVQMTLVEGEIVFDRSSPSV